MAAAKIYSRIIAVRDDPRNPVTLPKDIFSQSCGACGNAPMDVVFQDDGQSEAQGYGVCELCAKEILELVVN